MATWQSNPIAVDGFDLSVHAGARGVILGRVLDGVYGEDLLLTADQTDALIAALAEGKRRHLAALAGGRA